ncbi:MAG: DUF6391 domain-containing protein [Anaerolineaceae bacterium]
MDFFNQGIIGRIRRNHALEHATLQVLASRKKYPMLAGYSDWRGFWVMGDIQTEDLLSAAEDALKRLNAGESSLAIHPHCGTNFAISGLLAGSAAWVVMTGAGNGWKKKLERFPLVVTVVTLVLILAQPLGPMAQRKITTCPTPDGLKISAIHLQPFRNTTAHRVLTIG